MKGKTDLGIPTMAALARESCAETLAVMDEVPVRILAEDRKSGHSVQLPGPEIYCVTNYDLSSGRVAY